MIIKYTLSYDLDHAAVRGNALASGDEAVDKEVEDEILERLRRGDAWAWAQVTVTASCLGFEGHDHLGCCTYKDEDDFRASDYYKDMCNNARDEMLKNVEETRTRLAQFDAAAKARRV